MREVGVLASGQAVTTTDVQPFLMFLSGDTVL